MDWKFFLWQALMKRIDWHIGIVFQVLVGESPDESDLNTRYYMMKFLLPVQKLSAKIPRVVFQSVRGFFNSIRNWARRHARKNKYKFLFYKPISIRGAKRYFQRPIWTSGRPLHSCGWSSVCWCQHWGYVWAWWYSNTSNDIPRLPPRQRLWKRVFSIRHNWNNNSSVIVIQVQSGLSTNGPISKITIGLHFSQTTADKGSYKFTSYTCHMICINHINVLGRILLTTLARFCYKRLCI